MSAMVKLITEALIEALLTPGAEGEKRQLRVSAGGLALVLAILAILTVHVRIAAVEETVARVDQRTERIEGALIIRGARAAATPARPLRSPIAAWSFAPSAAAEEAP